MLLSLRLRHELVSLRVAFGLPVLFLTLNPADVRRPFTLHFSGTADLESWQHGVDEDLQLVDCLRQARLAHVVAQDPVAAVRAFHAHLRSWFQNACSMSPEDLPLDGVAASGQPSIFGPLLAGDPCTHTHFFTFTGLLDRRLCSPSSIRTGPLCVLAFGLAWVDTVLLTSVEQLCPLLGYPASDFLRHLRPLPFAEDHLQVLQETASEYLVHATTSWYAAGDPTLHILATEPWLDPLGDDHDSPDVPFARRYLHATDASSATHRQAWLYDFRHSLVRNALHVCRSQSRKTWPAVVSLRLLAMAQLQ